MSIVLIMMSHFLLCRLKCRTLQELNLTQIFYKKHRDGVLLWLLVHCMQVAHTHSAQIYMLVKSMAVYIIGLQLSTTT